jgi:hypothetical protein
MVLAEPENEFSMQIFIVSQQPIYFEWGIQCRNDRMIQIEWFGHPRTPQQSPADE